VGIKQVSDKGQVQLGVTSNKGLGREILATVELLGVLKNHLGARKEVVLTKRGPRADFWGQLVKQDGIVLSVLHIRTKVIYTRK